MLLSLGLFVCLHVGNTAWSAESPVNMISLSATPEPIDIDLSQTALLVVDMQNAFASQGGLFDRLGQDITGARRAVANSQKLVSAARSAGISVIYLKMKLMPESAGISGRKSPRDYKGLGIAGRRPMTKGKFIAQNPWNEEIVAELKPQAGDLVIEKKSYSGFAETELEDALNKRNIRYLIVAGVATNGCVESTVREAFARDYWPVLVADGTSSVGPAHMQQASIWNVETFFGWVTTTDYVLRALPQAP